MDAATSSKRFVVLLHEVGSALDRCGDDHFDWMFEQGDGSLLTWASPIVQNLCEDSEMDVIRLADHRMEYLEFEGRIDGDRGHVTRVVAGTYESREQSEDRFRMTIHWRDGSDDRRAELTFYRILVGDRSRREDNREGWCLRLSLCR